MDAEIFELWVMAPRGFRPSQWAEMLIDFDEAYDLDPELVDKRSKGREDILVIQGRLFAELYDSCKIHQALLLDVLGKVAGLGLALYYHPKLADQDPPLVEKVRQLCQEQRIPVQSRS